MKMTGIDSNGRHVGVVMPTAFVGFRRLPWQICHHQSLGRLSYSFGLSTSRPLIQILTVVQTQSILLAFHMSNSKTLRTSSLRASTGSNGTANVQKPIV